jgi:N-acetyl-beta-hexosaminidase
MRQIKLLVAILFVVMELPGQILPSPTKTELKEGHFTLSNPVALNVSSFGENSADYLTYYLKQSTGYEIIISSKEKSAIIFEQIHEDSNLSEEGYYLEVSPKAIIIKAKTEKGFFYGVQSLLQLFPVQIFSKKVNEQVSWKIPCQSIFDNPKYGFRSFMLDSGRQFQSPEFIKRYLDYIALLKFNVFHWHLTEGQGWRIEIKQYPKLTEIGSRVADGKEQQGYYTREDIKEIVDYAAKRYITIIPEIDVPGHSEAALSAYPEFSCLGVAPKSVMAFSPHIFCGGNEETYIFLKNVLDEVCELFPSAYIHLGGDEAPKAIWNECSKCQSKIKEEQLKNSHDLQLYFSKRLAKYLKSKNRKAVFWGDVVYKDGTKLPENVVIHWWNSRGHKDEALVNAIKRDHKVIAGTNYYSYLNFPVTPWSKYKINRTFDLKMMYENNVADLKSPPDQVLGMSTSLWTDWYVQQHMIDRRVFPRIFAIAEQMWSTSERKPFQDFHEILKSKYPMLEQLNIDFGPAMKEDITKEFKWD